MMPPSTLVAAALVGTLAVPLTLSAQPAQQPGTMQPARQPSQARPATQPRLSRAEAAERITRLGTSDALYRRLNNIDDLKRMAADRNVQRRLSQVMDDVGLTALTSEVLAALSAADPQRMREVQIAPETRLQWMAFRNGARGKVQRPAVWAGRQSFEAWQFTVEQGGTRYTFLVPRLCGNLSLLQQDVIPPPAPTVDRDAERRAQEERDRAERERLERERQERERADAERLKAEEARKAQEAAEAARLAEAERARQQAEQERLAREAREKVDWFVAGYFGKERRVRDVEIFDGTGGSIEVERGFCAPLFGAKVGADIRLSPSWRMAPAVGFAFNTDEGDDSSLFADLEFNYQLERGYLGTGVGIWDFTHSDTVAATWLIHGGVEVHRQANENRLFLAAEGRLFLNQFDDVSNNYQFWGGLRYVIR